MRETRYRGKRKDNGEWVYGSLIVYNDVHYTILNRYLGEHEVIPETVGQYTGIEDKNITGIYEGDIVKHIYIDQPFVVAWDDEWHGFNLMVDARPIEAFPMEGADLEIVGNIHEGELK